MKLKRLKQAMKQLLAAKELCSASLSVDACIEELNGIIREKIAVQKQLEDAEANRGKRRAHLQEMEAAAQKKAEESREFERSREVDQAAIAAAVSLRESKVSKANKLFKEAKLYAKSFRDFGLMEKAELRSHFRAYAVDMDKETLTAVMAKNTAPGIVGRVFETAVSQLLFSRAKEVAARRAEQRRLNEFVLKKRAKEAEVRRRTLMLNERKEHSDHLRYSQTLEEACRKGVPLSTLQDLIESELEAKQQAQQENSSSVGVGAGTQNGSDELFDQICRESNAMLVESAHPYAMGANHTVQLIPKENDYSAGNVDDGLVVVFSSFCDLRAGDAEIRLFRDEACTWPITPAGEPFTLGNLPTLKNPLFVENAESFTLQFEAGSWSNNHVFYSSWGWKMLVCKCRSKEEFG